MVICPADFNRPTETPHFILKFISPLYDHKIGLRIQDERLVNVNFWVTDVINDKEVYMLYNYENGAFPVGKAGIIRLKDGKLDFKLKQDADDWSFWGDELKSTLVLNGIRDHITKITEEALLE